MPLPLDITDLLHGKTVEWERLELKAGWNPLDVMQTLSAFASDFNDLGGGYVLIGVAERDSCAPDSTSAESMVTQPPRFGDAQACPGASATT